MWKKFLIIGLVALVAVPAGVYAAGFADSGGRQGKGGATTSAGNPGFMGQNGQIATNESGMFRFCEQHSIQGAQSPRIAGNGTLSGNVAGFRGAMLQQDKGNGQMLRTRTCDGTCDQQQDRTRNQTRIRDGSCRVNNTV